MFNKKLLATLIISSAMMAVTNQTAHAEAGISVTLDGSTPAPVTSNVHFKIVVPKVMILSVGNWEDTDNTVTWNYNFGESTLAALSNTDATATQWNAATASTPAASNANADDDGTSDGQLAVKVFGNFGNLALSSALVSDFAAIEAGFAKPKLSEISATNTGNITHGVLDDAGAIDGTSLTAANGIVLEEDTWTYKYTPTATPAGGTYDAEVQYTLATA